MDETVLARTIEVGGLSMHVTEAGAGEPILLLHGFPQSSREWRRVGADLARDARVVAPDLRGAGQSAAPPDGYDVDTVCADVVGLMDALGISSAAIVAHDWSAIVGFELCLRHPERVSAYVAIAVPAPYFRMTPRLVGAILRAMPHLWFQWVIATPWLGPHLLSGGHQRLSHFLLRASVRPMDDADVEAYVAALRDPARARAGSKLYRRLILPASMNLLLGSNRGRVLRTRTLVLFGADDPLVPRDLLTVRPEDAPDTIVEFVPGGKHFLVDDQPDAVARRIRSFLGLPAR